jgi:hypothetical protein
MNDTLRFRQIHLDCHTTEHIAEVGADFDPDVFVDTLKKASVNSITCFSRCHHGWIYHDTKFPYRHPTLTRNLLAEQITACHKADIRVPIYITVGWDHLMATLHPEWCEMDAEGRRVGRGPISNGGGWVNLDFASPYIDFVIDQTKEVLDIFGDEVDGFFFDIIFQSGVHSSSCMARFKELGWDPADPLRQKEMRSLLVAECCDRIHGAIRDKNKDCSVFFNGGHVGPDFRRRLGSYTHLEIESLPTGGWGYMHFPMTVRYSRTLGLDCLGMTGKFSETWGHFGSYKNPAALEYECFHALAQGSKCSVGDQIHPRGTLDPATYDLIGSVYRKVEEVEPWCVGARAVTEIGVLHPEEFHSAAERMDPRAVGAARILMESRHQFDFVDSEADWSGYKVLILPDVIPVSAQLEARLQGFLNSGGSILASHESLRGPDGGVAKPFQDALSQVGPELPFSPDFVRMAGETTDAVMYERGLTLTAQPGAEVLATVTQPYFNRTWETFISHAHSPAAASTDIPAVVAKGRVVCFAHPLFTTYAEHSMSFHRELALAGLRRVLPEPLIELEGPTSLQASITKQDERWAVHLLHYIPERRGLRFDIVEDPMPVLATDITVRVAAKKAYLVPSGQELAVNEIPGGIRFTVPAFLGRQIIALEP